MYIYVLIYSDNKHKEKMEWFLKKSEMEKFIFDNDEDIFLYRSYEAKNIDADLNFYRFNKQVFNKNLT